MAETCPKCKLPFADEDGAKSCWYVDGTPCLRRQLAAEKARADAAEADYRAVCEALDMTDGAHGRSGVHVPRATVVCDAIVAMRCAASTSTAPPPPSVHEQALREILRLADKAFWSDRLVAILRVAQAALAGRFEAIGRGGEE